MLLTSVVSLSTQAASPFTTEGKFSVGSDGSANYSIPIVVPPGTAGMQPQLALNYNSNGGNGIVGMGWGIDGLSQISRCPTTLEQDGVINGVNYTSTDRFCLDGQRLIATTDTYNTTTKQYATTSAYGANGTEYRTESANFAKIISYGQAGTGPAYFKVWTKSGQIIEYGNTADSGIEAQGKPTIRTWGVNKISDTKGNYIAVTYTEDDANGEAYVQKIDYTGNASSTPALTPYANIQFIYEARPDTNTAYQAGSVLKTTKRLTSIQTYNTSNLIKNYKLTYELSQSTNRSRLKTMQECDGGSTPSCKLPTIINWTNINNNFVLGQNWGTGGGIGYWSFHTTTTSQSFQVTGDFNGDGKTDFMYWDGANGGWQALISNSAGFAPVQNWGTGGGAGYWPFHTTTTSQTFQFTGDFNGDGKTDFMYWDGANGGWQALISNGAGFVPVQNWGTGGGVGYWPSHTTATSQSFQFTGDFNGDGKTDFMYWDGVIGWRALISTGATFAPGESWGTGGGTGYWPLHTTTTSQSFHLIDDFDGDGKTDFMHWDGSQGWKFLSNEIKYQSDLLSAAVTSSNTSVMYKSLTNGLIYTKDINSIYPIQDVQAPIYVVSSSSISDGVGGVVTTNYQYGGLKSHLRGRGSLGFRYVKESSSDSGLSMTIFYRQDFPFIGLPSQVEKRRLSDNSLLSVVQNTYANSDLATSTIISKFPYLSQSVEQAYELDSSLVSTTTTTNQYDDYGNVISVKVDDGLGNIKTTTSTYSNNVGNWLLGRLIRSTVTSVTP